MIFRKKKIFLDDASFETPAGKAFRRLKKNRTALFGLWLIIISATIAILGYLITPDKTPDANEIIPEISLQRPGFKMKFLLVRKEKESSGGNFISTMLFGRENDFKMVPVLDYKIEGLRMNVSAFMGEELEPEQRTYNLTDVVYANSLNDTSVTIKGDSILFKNFKEEKISASS